MSDKLSDYDQGFIDGLQAFAWSKDGIQYCGTTELWPLKVAVLELKKLWNYSPPCHEED